MPGLLAILGLLGLAQPPAEGPPDDARDAAEYEVYYHHVVINKTKSELKAVVVYLPIPASDAYQQVSDFRVELRGKPYPVANRTDPFGVKIRRVEVPALAPGEEAHVGFSCVAKLNPPARIDPASSTGALDQVPSDVRDIYVRDQPIFGLPTPIVQEHARKLLKEHPQPGRRAVAVHDLIASTFKYQGGDGWDPAPKVLERRSGSCSEFSYAFAALCRATGIPTRFVGASIFPAKSKLPFDDHGHHRWVEAFLPGLGWVPFDPTLDRANPARQTFVGTHHGRTLILTRIGDRSQQLGLSYVGSNSHGGETTRKRWFTWSQGTREQLAAALKLRDDGKPAEARTALHRLVKDWPGTRAAEEAQSVLASMP
jgi:transglutaminase-like putative cysteine protease